MKNWKLTLYIAALIAALSGTLSIQKAQAQVYGQVSLDLFYNELSPYGTWDIDPTYGDIWFPRVGADFRPYGTNGYWVMTEYGNTWVSNYSWGWAPFHYGRWVYTSHRGWGWIPGYEWGPAWVEWRSGNGYYGWAPMMPHVGVSISINIPVFAWIFTPVRYIYSPSYHRHAHYGRVNIYNRTTIIHNTYIVNNRHYYGGPARRDIERAIGRRVEVRSVRHADRPGAVHVDRRSVAIYRPEMDHNRSSVKRSVSEPQRRSVTSREANNARPTPNNARPQREMHIDNKGNVTIREGNRTTSRATTDNARREVPNRSDNTSRNVERNNRYIDRSATSRERNTNTTRPHNNRTIERREQKPQPQRVERPQRESRAPERSVRNSTPVYQTSNSGSSNSNRVSRSTQSPRVERPATPARSAATPARGGSSNHSERSRR
ncbi:DUF6600 domain-containing protein [Sphingobacterium thermophilum]|uniref:Prolin-rich transmembrane protein n=1 Tax=Sphingobacterium thermophilum TaxID=768534 RepID=A0ABP8R332_9SPHI